MMYRRVKHHVQREAMHNSPGDGTVYRSTRVWCVQRGMAQHVKFDASGDELRALPSWDLSKIRPKTLF